MMVAMSSFQKQQFLRKGSQQLLSAIRQWQQTEGRPSALLGSAEPHTYGRSITTETSGGWHSPYSVYPFSNLYFRYCLAVKFSNLLWCLDEFFSFNLCNRFLIYLYFCHPQNTTRSSNVFCNFSIHISSKYFWFNLCSFTFSSPELNFTFLLFLPSLAFSLLIEGYCFISNILL